MCRWMAWHGQRVLIEELLFKPRHGLIDQSLHSRMGAETTNGDGFGLGWEVVREPQGTLNLMSPRAFHHGGAFGTFGWIDPQRDLIGIYLIQRENGPSDARDAFIAMANAAVVD